MYDHIVIRTSNNIKSISVELKAVEKQLGSCVKKARPYYEARCKYRVEKELALRASERFEHAVSHQLIEK